MISPAAFPFAPPSILPVFLSRVREDGECWRWTAALGAGHRYPSFRGKYGHRLAYEWSTGTSAPPRETGLVVDHVCHVTACVRPEHLRILTNRMNSATASVRKLKERCKWGHRISGTNVYMNRGRRHCRACRKSNNSRYYKETTR